MFFFQKKILSKKKSVKGHCNEKTIVEFSCIRTIFAALLYINAKHYHIHIYCGSLHTTNNTYLQIFQYSHNFVTKSISTSYSLSHVRFASVAISVFVTIAVDVPVSLSLARLLGAHATSLPLPRRLLH